MIDILFVVGYKIGSTNPNAICANEIINALRTDFHVSVDIVGEDIFDQARVEDYRKNIFYAIHRIIKWPSVNPNAEIICHREIKKALSHKEYDCVIVMHKPYEAVYAMGRINKKIRPPKTILYELDPITNEIDENIGIGRRLFFLSKYSEMRAYKRYDHIIHMACNRVKYSAPQYRFLNNKFSYSDFPLIHNIGQQKINGEPISDHIVKIVYTGALDLTYRSPVYLLEVLKILHERMNIDVSFFTKGNCEEKIEEFSSKNKYIKQKGYIEKSKVEMELHNADILINIGNKYSSMLPSKLLTYIEKGKPIIHIASQSNDVCISYLQKYPLGLIIYETDKFEESVDSVEKFILDNYGKRLDSETICKLYIENTPIKAAQDIMKHIVN